MKYYYVAGIPYPDELYHYGIKGQKWGVRRFQNVDGSYTLVGKQRYGRISETTMNKLKTAGSKIASGTKKAAKAVGSAAKKFGTHKVEQFKDKHKWTMSDAELKERMNRINLEKQYSDAIRSTRKNSAFRRILGDILENGAKTIARGAFEKMSRSMFEGPDKNDPSYKIAKYVKENWTTMSKEDVTEAAETVKLFREIEGTGGGGKKKK